MERVETPENINTEKAMDKPATEPDEVAAWVFLSGKFARELANKPLLMIY